MITNVCCSVSCENVQRQQYYLIFCSNTCQPINYDLYSQKRKYYFPIDTIDLVI